MAEIDGSTNGALPLHLDVRDLKLIVTVARVGSLTGAAGVLHLSQSTLSHHLSELEGRIGAALFYRTGRRLMLTPSGELLHDEAGSLLEEIGSLEERLRNRDALRATTSLRFATECYTTYSWFARIAPAFLQKWPDVELKLVTEATADPLPALERGDLDVAITTRSPRNRRLKTTALFRDELIAAVAPDHPWAASRRASLEQFREVQLLTYASDPVESDFIREVLLPAKVLPSRTMGIKLTEAMLEFAKAGLGVAVVARWAAAEWLRSGALVAVKIGGGIHRTWNAVWLRSHPQAACLDGFARALRLHATSSSRARETEDRTAGGAVSSCGNGAENRAG